MARDPLRGCPERFPRASHAAVTPRKLCADSVYSASLW